MRKIYFHSVRFVYTILLTSCLPLLFLRLWWRGRKSPAYRQRWSERLGFYRSAGPQQSLWFHVVSFGETVAAVPLIKKYQAAYPGIPVVVTTTTPTGSALVKKQFDETVIHGYLPFDIPGLVERFLRHMNPKVAVVFETEIWPNLLVACRKRRIPVLLANARLSLKSTRKYQRLNFALEPFLGHISKIMAQTTLDAENFNQLGYPGERIEIVGNVKFDIQRTAAAEALSQHLSQLWAGRPTFIAASTHRGEEEKILDVFQLVRDVIPEVLLILVPRHPDRFKEVEALLEQRAYSYLRRSDAPTQIDAETAVFLGDTMGEMHGFYGAADVAFVGGSLVPVGGHNMLEPALAGRPVISGPYVHNFTKISELLLEAKSMVILHTPVEIAAQVISWLQNASQRQTAGQNGLQVVRTHQGATDKICQEIVAVMPESFQQLVG